jgi:hypothetical protein
MGNLRFTRPRADRQSCIRNGGQKTFTEGLEVLIVEDSPDTLMLLSTIFRREGANVPRPRRRRRR